MAVAGSARRLLRMEPPGRVTFGTRDAGTPGTIPRGRGRTAGGRAGVRGAGSRGRRTCGCFLAAEFTNASTAGSTMRSPRQTPSKPARPVGTLYSWIAGRMRSVPAGSRTKPSRAHESDRLRRRDEYLPFQHSSVDPDKRCLPSVHALAVVLGAERLDQRARARDGRRHAGCRTERRHIRWSARRCSALKRCASVMSSLP